MPRQSTIQIPSRRLARDRPNTFGMSVNDQASSWSARGVDLSRVTSQQVSSTNNLLHDVLALLNFTEQLSGRLDRILRDMERDVVAHDER
jgi:hypothetical protein